MTDSTAQHDYCENLSRHIALRVAAGESGKVGRFAELFFSRFAPEDLQGRNLEDDAGLMIDSWKRLSERDRETIQIHVFNPVHARDGWQSNHTVVRVLLRDMPFAVDSVLMALSHNGQITHQLNNTVFVLDRDDDGIVQTLSVDQGGAEKELLIYAEVDRLADEDLAGLKSRLQKTVTDLEAVVTDFGAMKAKLEEAIECSRTVNLPEDEVAEALAFMAWLSADRFTFLGFREFE
ncbi:MAG: hypothetical protein ACC642_06715, partial [Pseudomonadales bacterium]